MITSESVSDFIAKYGHVWSKGSNPGMACFSRWYVVACYHGFFCVLRGNKTIRFFVCAVDDFNKRYKLFQSI